MVSALFVQTGGVYYGLPNVDPWDEHRDARRYQGPHPVIAHPPCARWCGFARLNEKRYGKLVGDDSGCFESALSSVRRFGGVLEHPAGSLAWRAFQLMLPSRGGWSGSSRFGWVTEVSQSAYGHRARKRTWLYVYSKREPLELDWSNPAGTHQVGWFDRNKPTIRGHAASATPPAFRDVLIRIAEGARS